jgi:hypothetical protein
VTLPSPTIDVPHALLPHRCPPRGTGTTGSRGGHTSFVLAGTWIVLTTLLHGCHAPRLELRAEPDTARIVVDGEVQKGSAVGGPIRYYGTVEVAALPESDARPAPRPTRTTVEVDPPAPLWMFPFDFFVEHGRALCVEDPTYAASLTLEPRTDVPEVGTEPAELGAFRERARDAARAR